MREDISYLKKYIIKYKLKIVIAILFLGLETLTGLVQPFLMSKIIDKGVRANNLRYVYRLGLIMVLLTGIMAVFTIIRNRYSSMVSQNIGADIREDLYIHIQSLAFEDINKLEVSSLITRITNDVSQIQGFLHSIMRVFLKAPLIGLGSVIMSFFISWKLALIILAIILLVIILIRVNLKISYPLFRNIQIGIDNMNKRLREYLSGIRVVKAFNMYAYEEEKFEEANLNYKKANIKGQRVTSLFSPLVSLIVNFGIVMIIYFGGISVSLGNLKIGQVVALIDYMTQILFSLVMLNNFLNRGLRARTSAERIGEVLNLDKDNMEGLSNICDSDTWDIEFKDVDFSYGDNLPLVLKGISFKIKKGERVAIIGSTGSGKTTLINLLARFYEVDRGSIYINGVDIREIDKRFLRSNIGIVSQNTLLFKGSIKDNLNWTNEKVGKDKIIEISKLVEANDFISSFKDGYETIIGEGGVNLSGGQKQRISIGRTLLTSPKVLILDDSTSALDVITENKLRQNLNKLDYGMTIITIAQRINSVRYSDNIIVMEKGEIVDIGRHEDLIKKSRVYQEIYKSQIGGEERGYEVE